MTRPSEFTVLPGAPEALAILRDLGFLLILVTNQRGIARGLMTDAQLREVHAFMEKELKRFSASVDAIYHCPHDRDEKCGCRKPEPGMILKAAREHNVDLEASYMVGDSDSDVEAASRAGVRSVRISAQEDGNADMTCETLLDFAELLSRDGSPLTQTTMFV